MELIHHRINTIRSLIEVPCSDGVEVDVRSNNDRLYVGHDPFVVGEDFDLWLAEYGHGTLIINVKEEGLEGEISKALRRRALENFFLLDQSFPFLERNLGALQGRSAVRVSDYEGLCSATALSGRANWAWLDWFGDYQSLDASLIYGLRSLKYRICLVSPELHGWAPATILSLRQRLGDAVDLLAATCTKLPELWRTPL